MAHEQSSSSADRREASVVTRRRAIVRVAAVLTGAAGIGSTYEYFSRRNARSLEVRQPDLSSVVKPPPPVLPVGPTDAQRIARVYHDSIVPLLSAFDARNAAAAQRGVLALHDRISMHRAGIPPFTRDIVSWRTRMGVIRRYSSDLWRRLRHGRRDVTLVSQYVNEKFRRYILSESALRQDVSTVLTQFEEDMRASRNRLYSDLSLPLASLKVSAPAISGKLDDFQQDVQRQAQRMTGQLAVDTVMGGLAAVAGGWVATDVAQAITSRVVTQVLAQVGAAMAAEGIEAGGATAGGAAIGGGGGSLAGPLGTIIGLGVGLIVGAIIDWRLSRKFEQKVAMECSRFLDVVESRLRNGAGNSPGLQQVFEQTALITGQVQRQAISAVLKGSTTHSAYSPSSLPRYSGGG